MSYMLRMYEWSLKRRSGRKVLIESLGWRHLIHKITNLSYKNQASDFEQNIFSMFFTSEDLKERQVWSWPTGSHYHVLQLLLTCLYFLHPSVDKSCSVLLRINSALRPQVKNNNNKKKNSTSRGTRNTSLYSCCFSSADLEDKNEDKYNETLKGESYIQRECVQGLHSRNQFSFYICVHIIYCNGCQLPPGLSSHCSTS